MREITLIDTTLRDGLQGISKEISHSDAVSLARALVEAGVGEIEAGIAARPDDRERIRHLRAALPNARLATWCRLRPEDLHAARDCPTDVVHFSLPGSDRLLAAFGHDRAWRRRALEAVLCEARDAFPYVSIGIQDAAGTDLPSLREIFHVAQQFGADRVRLADSPGRWLPNQAARVVARLLPLAGKIELGIHAHDDLGLATAVTLAALEAGAASCDVTVCGVGERAGNAALEQVALACHTAGIHTRVRTECLTFLSRLAMATVGRHVPIDQPIVGTACFVHHSGLHQAAMTRDPGCYEPFAPSRVGSARSEPIDRHLGRAGLARALTRLGLPADAANVAALLPQVLQVAAGAGRPLRDEELRHLAQGTRSCAATEGRKAWSFTSPPTTSSSATASGSPEPRREPAPARRLPSSSSTSKKSSPTAASMPSSRQRVV